MVQTQFHKKIHIFRSDNGKEYFNKILGSFFLETRIIHRSSSNDTPQQNGLAERKNKHLLEVARVFLFITKVPKFFWGETFIIATYLINQMPSKVLNFETPFNIFHKFYPMHRPSSTLPLKKIGCTTFVRIHDHN